MVELQFVEIHNWFLLCVRVRSSLTVALDPAVGSIRTPEADGMVDLKLNFVVSNVHIMNACSVFVLLGCKG